MQLEFISNVMGGPDEVWLQITWLNLLLFLINQAEDESGESENDDIALVEVLGAGSGRRQQATGQCLFGTSLQEW